MTRWPASASTVDATDPAGPPPITTTSGVDEVPSIGGRRAPFLRCAARPVKSTRAAYLARMARQVAPDLPVYLLDTGFHFAETLAFAERIRREWGINLILQRPKLFGEAFRAEHGALYERDSDRCCHLNKVEPQRELLERYQGWITGVRRDQAETRKGAETLELLEGEKLKVQPLARWTRPDVEAYIRDHAIPDRKSVV